MVGRWGNDPRYLAHLRTRAAAEWYHVASRRGGYAFRGLNNVGRSSAANWFSAARRQTRALFLERDPDSRPGIGPEPVELRAVAGKSGRTGRCLSLANPTWAPHLLKTMNTVPNEGEMPQMSHH